MKSLDEIIQTKATGLYFGNRLILPFHAHFLKVVVEDKIISDFSMSSKGIHIVEEDEFTSLYFLDYDQLVNSISKYETIKLLVVGKSKNIFDTANHKKIAVYLEEKHSARIEQTNEDILFIE